MKVALVYDRVNKFGGAERVLLSLKKIFPEAPLYTLVYNPPTASWARSFKVVPTFFNKLKFLRLRHEILAPFSALAFETFDLKGYDVIISVTSEMAKAVVTRPETFHLCYCLTPTRYLHSGLTEYRSQVPAKTIFDWYLPYARRADRIFATRPDAYLAISDEVSRRIKEFYTRPAEVIYPPVNYDFFAKDRRRKKGSYYLVVSRLVRYKKTDLVVKAFNRLKLPLIIVGAGREEKRLKKLAGDTVEFAGLVDDVRLRRLYAGARALIFPQVEDFGLVPLEAAAAGTPTLAYAGGGATETIIDKFTGLFFNEQSTEAIISVVRRFEAGRHQISPKKCQERAREFGQDRFTAVFSAKVNSLWREYLRNMSLS